MGALNHMDRMDIDFSANKVMQSIVEYFSVEKANSRRKIHMYFKRRKG